MRSEHRLTLAALEEFDPRAPARGTERRFCCPICGREKRVDAAHRHLSANLKTGAWNCHCCDGRGKLQEFWTEREAAPIRRRRPIPRAFVLRPEPTREPEPEPKQVADLAEKLAGCRDLLGSRGEQYLLSRELNPSLAAAADVQFHPAWDGRAAVVFPLIDRAGATVAAEARFLHVPEGRRKSGCRGPKSSGAFVTPGALGADLVALVEGPACALTLAALGLPAIAVMGRELPDWLRLAMARRRVLIASDADAAGDTAAEEWGAALRAFGARVERFRPEGEKDWNDLLREDPEGLARQLEALGLAVPVPSSETPPAPVAGEDDDPFLLLDEDPDAPPLCGWPAKVRAKSLLADPGWFRAKSRATGTELLVVRSRDDAGTLPARYADLPHGTVAAVRWWAREGNPSPPAEADPEGLARRHREQQAAADRELVTGAALRAEVGHIFAGVSLETEHVSAAA